MSQPDADSPRQRPRTSYWLALIWVAASQLLVYILFAHRYLDRLF